jgi:hypothetical protein
MPVIINRICPANCRWGYVTGQKINGNSYWDYIFSAWGDGLVADFYLYAGGNIYDQVQGC